MKNNHVLIDFESVQPKSLDLLKPTHFWVHIFLGPTNTKIPRDLVTAMQCLGERGNYVELEVSGKNALDFHIAYYLGRLAVNKPDAYFHVISRDHGFDPLIAHLRSQKIFIARSELIEQMPCFVEPTAAAVSVASVAAKPTPALVPAPKPKSTPAASATQVNMVIANLVKRKSARPAKEATLLSSIHNIIGKNAPVRDAEAILAALIKRKHIAIANNKLTYNLPVKK